MSNSRNPVLAVGFASMVLVQSATVNATPLAQDLESCAVEALAKRDQIANKITVRTNGLSRSQMDIDNSKSRFQFQMSVTDKYAAEELGIVTCTISRDGKLIASSFDS